MKKDQHNRYARMYSLLVVMVLLLSSSAAAALQAVGPVNPATGFPAWYQDTNGIALELMEAADGFGISAPVEPGNAFSQQIGFGAEGFWWAAEADVVGGVNTINGEPVGGLAIMAMEAAFAGETAVDGEQSAFGRVRFVIDGLVTGETYTITYPFGTLTLVAEETRPDTPTIGEIITTSDIGCFAANGISTCDPAKVGTGNPPLISAGGFAAALSSDIGPFLRWDTFNLNPALTDPALVNPAFPGKRYVGNFATPHAVVGSPTGQNVFRVEGPGIPGGFMETTLFNVGGRIAIIDTQPPVIVSTTPPSVEQDSTNVLVSARITDDLEVLADGAGNVIAATLDTSSLGNSFSATLNGGQEVPPVATSATGTGAFVIDTNANTLSFDITYSGLQGGPETGAHIHGPAAVGGEALPVFDLPATAGSKVGTWNYPENLEADILAGNMYVNIHTTLPGFTDGEIRGQIVPTPSLIEMITATPAPRADAQWSAVIPGPLTRVGTFNLPLITHDGSNVVNGVLTIEVLSPLASVLVEPATAIIVEGNTQQLVASPLGRDSLPFVGAVVTWASDNPAVATVDANGLVTAVAPVNSTTVGIATITGTATFQGNSVTDTSVVTVTPIPVLTVLDIAPLSGSVSVGNTVQLNASPKDQLGFAFAVPVTFASSDPLVATVDANGLVSAVAPGSANITATAVDGLVSLGAISVVTVEAPVVTTVGVTPAAVSIEVSATQQLSASVLDQFGGTYPAATTVNWTTSDPLVATVDATGLVTGVGLGSATITATATDGVTSNTGQATVNVAQLTTVNVPAAASLTVGGTSQLTAAALDQNGAPFLGAAIAWSSSNTSVATVDANGLVTAVSLGSATITATASSLASTVTGNTAIKVTTLGSAAVSPASASILVGGTSQLTASVTDVDGQPFVGAPVTWTSSNPAVATVSASGLVSGVAAGQATVTATVTSGSQTVAGTSTVTVSTPSSGGGGGGGSSSRRSSSSGGSSGGSSNVGIPVVTDLGDLDDDSSSSDDDGPDAEELEDDNSIEFRGPTGASKRFSVRGATHTLKVDSVTDDSATFTLSSTPVQDTLMVGQSRSYDLSDDGRPDVQITLQSITSRIPTFLVQRVDSEPVATSTAPTTQDQAQQNQPAQTSGLGSVTGQVTGEPEASGRSAFAIGAIVIIGIALVGTVVLAVVMAKRRKEE